VESWYFSEPVLGKAKSKCPPPSVILRAFDFSAFTAAITLCPAIYAALKQITLRLELLVAMFSPMIVPYQPNAAVRSRRIDAKDWERLRPRLEELYIKDDKKLEEVMEIMAVYDSFHAR
jgi:predicted nucleic acid-binding protein